jgi:5'-3' exonuclease
MNKELAFLSKRLVTIDTNVPLNINFHQLRSEKRNNARLIELFKRLEFHSLIAKLRADNYEDIPSTNESDVDFIAPEPLANISTDKHQYHLIITLQPTLCGLN